MTSCFRRCKEYTIESLENKSGDWETRMRVELGEYWLDWSDAAHRAEFDFDYLASLHPSALHPVEMRFYELAQLLRVRGGGKPASTPLVIGYNELTQLMPLPKMTTLETVENQISELCAAHLTRGYLKNIGIKPINRKGAFADAELEMSFNN